MRRRPTTSAGLRALVGAMALYALLLQAFFAAATPVAASGLAGVICTVHGGTEVPDLPARNDHACCTAAHLEHPAPPPQPASTAVAWSVPRRIAAVWHPHALVSATGPPTRAHTARGPPSA